MTEVSVDVGMEAVGLGLCHDSRASLAAPVRPTALAAMARTIAEVRDAPKLSTFSWALGSSHSRRHSSTRESKAIEVEPQIRVARSSATCHEFRGARTRVLSVASTLRHATGCACTSILGSVLARLV